MQNQPSKRWWLQWQAGKPLQGKSGVANSLSQIPVGWLLLQIRQRPSASALPNAASYKQPLRILASIALLLILGGFPFIFFVAMGVARLSDFKVQKSADKGSFAFSEATATANGIGMQVVAG